MDGSSFSPRGPRCVVLSPADAPTLRARLFAIQYPTLGMEVLLYETRGRSRKHCSPVRLLNIVLGVGRGDDAWARASTL